MIGRKTDKRTIMTKAKIIKTLAILLKEKDISQVTVRELAEKVGIHRATFYAHYTDIYQVYDELLNQIFSTMTHYLSSDEIISYQAFYNMIVQSMQENKDICKMLFSSEKMILKLQSFFEKGCITTWKEEHPNFIVTDIIQYYSNYRVSGIIAVLKNWVLNDYDLPSETILTLIAELDSTVDLYITAKCLKLQ